MSFVDGGLEEKLLAFLDRHENNMTSAAYNDYRTTLKRFDAAAHKIYGVKHAPPALSRIFGKLARMTLQTIQHDAPRQASGRGAVDTAPRRQLNDDEFKSSIVLDRKQLVKSLLRQTREYQDAAVWAQRNYPTSTEDSAAWR